MNIKKIIHTAQEEVPIPYASWLGRELMRATNKWRRKLPYTGPTIEIVREWIQVTRPDLNNLSIDEAASLGVEWAIKKERKSNQEQYKTHDIVYIIKNEKYEGYEVVKLSPQDIFTEDNLMIHKTDSPDYGEKYYVIDSRYSEEEIGKYFSNTMFEPESNKKEIESGKYQIYSIRDKNNYPVATIEILQGDNNLHTVNEVFSAEPLDESRDEDGFTDKIHPYKEAVKEFLDYLKKQGYKFKPRPADENQSSITPNDLDTASNYDEFGLAWDIAGIGDYSEQYYENLEACYSDGWGGSYWYESKSKGYFDNLLAYAERTHELKELQGALAGFSTKIKNKEGKMVDLYKSFDEWAQELWFQYEIDIPFENKMPDDKDYPDKEDFMIAPRVPEGQEEFTDMPQSEPIFNEEEYNQAIKEFQEAEAAYEKELDEHQKYFEPFILLNYAWKETQNALKEAGLTEENKEVNSKMSFKMYKIAIKDEEIPKADVLATYVESLKMYLKDNPKTEGKFADLINNLPNPIKIHKDFSIQECKILHETVAYLWRKITGKKIVDEVKIIEAPESLFGNYWMIKNGILLHGTNHFTIIKQNAQLIASLLKLNAFTLEQYLCSEPNKLIQFIIKNGGVRLFINKNKKMQIQMSSKTYGKWGKKKIKKYDFSKKIVRIVDFKVPYEGWKSGIPIKL